MNKTQTSDETFAELMVLLAPLCDRKEPTICQIAQFVEDNKKRFVAELTNAPKPH